MTQTSGTAPSAEKPFFRYDLQTEAIEDGGQRFVEVTDPNGGKSFRFFEVEYAVACGMDGERSLEALVDWAKSELDLKTTTDELGAIVSKLSELEYLGAGESTASQAEAQDEVAALPEIPAAPVFDEPSSGIEVELGTSGKSPLREDRPAPPAVAADFELGVAGVGEVQRSGRESRDTANMALGAAGNEDVVDAPQDDFVSGPSKEVSTDLSQTFRIDKDEVQAAVRASKVMSAVELPKDIGNELANDQDTLDPAIPEAIPLAADISESIADEASEANSGGKAIVLPEEPAKVAAVAEETKKKPKGPRRNSASMVLWVILLLSAAAFAGYYYMEYVREQPDEKGPVTTPQQAEAQRRAKEPAAPAVPTSTLKVVSAPIEDVVAGRDGLVSWVVAAKTEVAEGDELVRLSGHERADKTIDRHNKSLASYEAQLKIAKDRNRAKVATIESNVARKKLDIELANEKRDAFIIRASIAGVVEPMVKPTAQIKAADVVANITGEASALVEFALPKGTTATVGEQMDVVAKGDAELKSTCTVAEAAGQKVTLSCPTDSGFADGTILELAVPSEAEAAAAGDEAAGDEAAGDEAAGDEADGDDADGDEADADEAAADGDAADADEADGDDAP